MNISAWFTQYVVAAIVFLILDGLWLGVLAKQHYQDRLGELMADRPNVTAAVLFYLLFVAGLVFFVVEPAVDSGSWSRALLAGAFLGLLAYGTWNLTNLAVIEGFPGAIVPVDMAWGTVVTATTAVSTYAVCQVLPAWAR